MLARSGIFSNHIRKSGAPLSKIRFGALSRAAAFSTLFESRLIRAKQYLDQPLVIFEMTCSDSVLYEKIVASDPIHAQHVASWDELRSTDRGLMILNGDSSRLPVPDASVDDITDPPYFDFVHYSELSDFFFAGFLRPSPLCLVQSGVLQTGRVQHKDPRVFAKQLGSVFAECRVLKDDGVLAFSFHHSRAEGWAAIYEAITSTGRSCCRASVHALSDRKPQDRGKIRSVLMRFLCASGHGVRSSARSMHNHQSLRCPCEQAQAAGISIDCRPFCDCRFTSVGGLVQRQRRFGVVQYDCASK